MIRLDAGHNPDRDIVAEVAFDAVEVRDVCS
jgi:hypothetical protein